MLKFSDTDVVFQEIPDEVTLAINLTGCPCRCPGCHSRHLWADTGVPLTIDTLDRLIASHRGSLTCISFMGGDADPSAVNALLGHIRQRHPSLHTSWWSGRTTFSPAVSLERLNYLKLGPYLAHLGPLRSPTTNQRLYRIVNGRLIDITHRLNSRPVPGSERRASILNAFLPTTAQEDL